MKVPSAIFKYQNTTGHITTVDNFQIIGREGNNIARAMKEATYIKVNNPKLNKNIGKYNLPHICDEVLYSTSEVK